MLETRIAVALRPLLVMFYCLGIDLNENRSYKIAQRIYSAIWMGLVAVTSCSSVIFELIERFKTTDWRKPTSWNAENTNAIINSFNFSIINILFISIALHLISWKGSADLWKALHQLEELQCFDSRFYRTIRRQSWLAVFFILLNASTITTVSSITIIVEYALQQFEFFQVVNSLVGIYNFIPRYSGLHLYVIYIIQSLIKSLPVGSYSIFAIIGSTMATSFHRMKLDFKMDCRNRIPADKNLRANALKLQLFHRQICLVVDQLHHRFEWVSLAHVFFTFLSVINITFYIMNGVSSLNQLHNFITWTVEVVLRLWMISYIPDRIKMSVIFQSFQHHCDYKSLLYYYRPQTLSKL